MGCVQILIADDHELFRRTVRSFIESQPDFRVCGEATDGLEAVEKVRDLQPHVVLMDINMPRMDGLEATRIIRREHPDCNVIIVTQNHATIAREQARGVNAHGSITKSDLTKDLLATIESVFKASHPERLKLTEEPAPAGEWVQGGGALGRLVHEFDWRKTPLGAIEQWPYSLKTVVRVMLTSRFAMWMSWGPELTFLYNDAYAKMTLGKKHPWALGKPSQRVWEEIWGDIGPRIERVLRSGNATWDEGLLLFLERSGYREETYHTFSYSPLTGDDGKVCGHLCVVTEETDRVIGERRLKTLRTLASELSKTTTEQEVVESIPRVLEENQQDLPFSLAYLFSEDGKSARLCCRTGVSGVHSVAPEIIDLTSRYAVWPVIGLLEGRDSIIVEELPARFPSIPTGAWDKSPDRALLLPIASQSQGAPAGVLIAALNPYRPLDVSYAGFLNLVAGQIAASIANARSYEQERKRAESLAEIDRAKTVFFSNVSHEFRTPLTLMLAPLEDMLAQDNVLPPDQRERVDIAHRNSLRLLKLVNTLLDFSRIEAGRFQASYEPTDPSQLTSELASVFRSAIERAGLRFFINTPSIPESVYVDRELWEKIVFNLLSNAFKFTLEGEIEISIRKVDAAVELAVRDTGTGIPLEDLPHLFERFYRVKGAHGRTFEGTGIGLALVQELAKLHGGTVRVDSEVGRGSTFTVAIPLGKAHLPQDRIGAPRTLASTALRGEAYVEELLHWLPDVEKESASVTSFSYSALGELTMGERRARVLLADDNADMRDYVRKLLSPVCDVRTVPDGQAALDAVREDAPDIIVSDVMMPKLDGFALLKELRSNKTTAGIPVILLSARAGEESRVEGLASGADDYLTKPFSARELLARVKSQLNMARVRHESVERERKLRAQAELGAQKLEQEASALKKLNECSSRLWQMRTLHDGLREMLSATIELLGADKGNVQLLHAERGVLTIAAQKGFGNDFLDFFREVSADEDCACGRTLRRGERTIIEDIEQDVGFAPFRHVARAAGYRSVISTPLMGKNGAPLGILSTHFRLPHRPSELELARLDLYARQGADFVERYKNEEILRRSEEQLRAIVETTPECIKLVSKDGTLLHMNSSGLQMVEADSAEQALGKNIYDVIAPEDRERFRTFNEQVCAGRRGALEFDIIGLKGTRRHMETHAAPLCNPDGNIVQLAVTRDITQRKEAEKATGLLAAIVTSSDDGIVSKNLNGIIQTWNKGAERIFGYTAEETVGQHIKLIIPPERHTEEDEILARLGRGEPIDHFQAARRRKDGTLIDVSLTISPVRDSSGRVIGASKVARDITAQKRAEQALRESEQRYRTVTDASPVMVWMSGTDRLCYYFNKVWLDFVGHTMEQEIGNGWAQGVHPDDVERCVQIYESCFDARRPFEMEYRLRHHTGQYRWILDCGRPRYAPDGTFEGYVGGCLDIHDRKQAAEKIRMADETVRLMRIQDEERRRIARELHDSAGQTLTVLGLNLAQLVQKVEVVAPELVKDGKEIEEVVQQLHREIRTTSYLLHPPLLDEAGLSSALKWYVQGLAERSGMKIDLNISDDFGRLPADMELAIFRVVQECLTNIHRHAESKTAFIRIARENGSICVQVRDEGKGISPERLVEIQSRGSGVGIAGIRERLRHFQGEMKIESDSSGTRVLATIALPNKAPLADQKPLHAAV